MSLIRGVLLAGKFRSQHELNEMSSEDHRNTLITELNNRTNQPVEHYQALNDDDLAGVGAVVVFVREGKIRDDETLKKMSDEDARNTTIVEISAQTGTPVPIVQGMKNIDLVLAGLGRDQSFIRGVLLTGSFRTQHELNEMSSEDHRNTLITELANRTNQPVGHYQALNDDSLAGAGAALVFIRSGRIRGDGEITTMSDDDCRNTVIVEINAQTGIPVRQLQGLGNLALVSIAIIGDLRGAQYLEAVAKRKAKKSIEDRWNTDGRQLSAVGLPRIGADIEPYRVPGGYQADFRSGSIRILDNNKNTEIAPGDWVRVWWVGLECVIRQEGEDEVYGSVFCHSPGRSASASVAQFPGGNETLEMGKPGGRVVLTSELLYEGPLVNVTIGAILIENDSGDVEEISKQVADTIVKASAALLSGLTGVPADAVANQTWYKEGIGKIAGFVLDDVFGIGDDPYLPVAKFVPWQTLAEFAPPRSYQRPGEPQVITAFSDFIDASGVDDGGDRGQYRFYFLFEHANFPG
ncbi:hypothetical protein [Nocardia yamanashiensis]|uniref:hypothetical protein n=1 Tax=Nocardia yamanashiensis TaxID=209247 RepID=UPI0008314253|nr:hypothetical protein [Nocardia yamanashiensis]